MSGHTYYMSLTCTYRRWTINIYVGACRHMSAYLISPVSHALRGALHPQVACLTAHEMLPHWTPKNLRLLFGFKRQPACSCHVCSISYKKKKSNNQTKECYCLRLLFLLIRGSDRSRFSSDSCGDWCQHHKNKRQESSSTLCALLGCFSFPWIYYKAGVISASRTCSSLTFLL